MCFWPPDPKGLFLDPLAISPWKFVPTLVIVSAEAVFAALTCRAMIWGRRGVPCP